MPSSPTNAPAADADTGVPSTQIIAACLVATLAFWAYSRTLLPGVDLGDTGGFQAAVLWPDTSARRAYPLYYGIASAFVALTSADNPARGLNLFSAVFAAAAAGLLTFMVAALARSALAGAVAGVLLAFSYTFWTQAIIAEVYSLHLTLVALCLVALYRFAQRPTTGRLATFFVIYAFAFGNHLSMILLLPPFAVFLLLVHPRPRELFRPAIVALAIAIAVAGALQYTRNFMAVWSSIDAPDGWGARLAAFWFDTTKSDWRESMVFGVGSDQTMDRLAMWRWDARQQFGIAGLVLAAIGALRLWAISRAWAALVWIASAVSTIFALTYNVGDTHVFFLPGHFFTAFAAGVALAPWGSRSGTVTTARTSRMRGVAILAAVVALLYGGWRAWDTWPAVDRHRDRRADELVAHVAQGLSDREAVLISNMDWQSENALLYSARFERRDLAWTRLANVLPHLPFLVRDNQAIGRDVVLTSQAAADVLTAYGPLFPLVQDETTPVQRLAALAATIPRGAPYVLTLLTPPREERFDVEDFDRSLSLLTGGRARARTNSAFQVWSGAAGEPPVYQEASSRPFRATFSIAGDPFTVRMESWLPMDTFRRASFGHVLRGREHLLAVERGVSLVWFRRDGSPAQAYAAGLYAPKPRFRIPGTVTHLASVASGFSRKSS